MVAELADPRPAAAWLTGHLAHLVPGPASVDARAMTKRCTELALTCSYLDGWVRDGTLPADPFAAELPGWEDLLRSRCEDPGLRRRALEDQGEALFHAQPYLWLRASGYRQGAWEDALARLASTGARPSSMGLLHCLWKAGLLRREPDWSRAVVRWLAAWSAGRPRKWDHNAYRVTHAAFYVSDFGNQDPPVAAADRDRIVELSRRLLDRAVARPRWDLAGELLVALSCLDREDARHRDATRAFRAARLAYRDDPDRPATGDGETLEQRDETFRRGYHTTIVDVLRCATMQRRGEAEARGQAAACRAEARGHADACREAEARRDAEAAAAP